MPQSSRVRGTPPGDPGHGWIKSLPKCELHVHLEGTLEPSLQSDLAARHGLVAAPRRGAEEAAYAGLADFLADYYAAMDVLRKAEDFERLTGGYLRRAAADGVVHTEMFFDPQAHTGRGVDFDDVVDGITEARHRAATEGGPSSDLILCLLRDAPVDDAHEMLEAALRPANRDRITGIGLDSDEWGNPPGKFAAVFADAKAAGFRITAHCDPRQPEAIANLWQCMDIGVERIDHGVDCLADDHLVEEIRRRGLGLTACPLSNRVLYGDMMATDVAVMLERGLLVTVNSDDPAYFGGYVADNYVALADAGFTRAQLLSLARNGFEASWLDEATKQKHLASVDALAGEEV